MENDLWHSPDASAVGLVVIVSLVIAVISAVGFVIWLVGHLRWH